MSAPPFMPLYVGDYLADTTHLTAGEDGAYMRLLMCMWRAGGSLPNDDVRLARFCKLTPAQWARIKPTVMEFFTVADGVLSQRRLSKELQKHTAAVFQRREAGSRGGQAKALKDKETSLAGAMRSLCQPEPEPEPDKEGDLKVSVAQGDRQPVQEAFEKWNDVARMAGLPVAKSLTPTRRRQIRARLAADGLDGWCEALAAVADSPLCLGQNERGWRADLDFVCQPKSFAKLREGSYGPLPVSASGHGGKLDETLMAEHQARQLAYLENLDA